MKSSSREHVTRCEGATTPPSQCQCRCKCLCHGRRLIAQSAGREAYEALPATDPHHLQTADERRAAASVKRERERIKKRDRGRRAHIEDVPPTRRRA